MAEEHDRTHRLLFAFPRMIEDLIRLFLGGAWVERLDFSTLEKVSERLLSPELVRREQDVLWRLRYRSEDGSVEDWFYVYIHLEHVAKKRQFMALDTTTYKVLALQELARRKELTSTQQLPPVFSAVLYTGAEAWQAPTSLVDLLQPLPDAPAGLDLWSYRLIDAQRHPLEDFEGVASPLVGLLRLERLGDLGNLADTARQIKGTLAAGDHDLAQAFVALINEVVLGRLTPKGMPRLRITDLEEVPSMLAQTIDNITQNWLEEGRREGLEKGRQEGRQEGRLEGAAHMFLELFAARLGDVPAAVRQRVTAAREDELEVWAKRLLRAERPEDVFAD